jgi:stearoyl-CoA desaturase (delta-9 desaturase)
MTLFLTVFVLSYLYHGLGITLGYHRLLSHRSFKCPKWFEYFIVMGGYLALEGSPIYWVTTHRLHHRYSDRPGDPHSPRDGLWHSFLGWMTTPTVRYGEDESRRLCPDLYRDPFYKFLHAHHTRWHALLCLSFYVAFRLLILAVLGPVALAANMIAALLPFIGALLVNSFGHIPGMGYQNFKTGEDSQNVWWIASLSLGEGWHNNHHAIPVSARHGMKASEPDLTWEAIRLLKLFGIVRDLRMPESSPRFVQMGIDTDAETSSPEKEKTSVSVGSYDATENN